MDRLTRLVVVGLVVTAGCNALPVGGGGTSDSGGTLTPVPVTETDAVDAGGESRPPWLAADGTVRVTRLRQSHEAAVANRTYTWTFIVNRTDRGAVIPGKRITRRVSVGKRAVLVRQTGAVLLPEKSLYVTKTSGYITRGVGFVNVTSSRYLAGDRAVARTVTNNSERVRPVGDPGDSGRYVYADEMITRFLSGVSLETRLIERDGQPLYRLYRPPGTPPDPLADAQGVTGSVQNYAVTAYVTPAGFVRTLIITYDQRTSAQYHNVELYFDYQKVGTTTVEEPDWLPSGDRTVTSRTGAGTVTASTAGETATARAANGTATPR